MMSIVPMSDDSYEYGDDGSYWSGDDLDASAATVKISNRQWPRRSSHQDAAATPDRSRLTLMAEASRWESFPSSRRLAPPRRPITPPPTKSSTASTCSSLSSDSSSTPPPLLATVRQESQGCSAPRVPQRKSSLEAVKRPCDCNHDATEQPQLPAAPLLRRHISDDSISSGKRTFGSPANSTLRLPTRQPSFQT